MRFGDSHLKVNLHCGEYAKRTDGDVWRPQCRKAAVTIQNKLASRFRPWVPCFHTAIVADERPLHAFDEILS
jgi:hypothetical protein